MSTTPQAPHKAPCRRSDAEAVLRRLREAGHVAYFAGGCVRDQLLGLEPADWDVATDAPPDRVRQLFSATQAVGAAFGVILVRHGRSVVEVATFRADGGYEDGRRPTQVRFTNAQDAQRRDFTINGLFLDPIEDQILDYVGGRADLEARRLRAIGNPAERFREDHLRLLRAVRFASRFNLTIDPATAEAARADAPRLKGISPERIAEELRLMLTSPTRNAAWRWLWDLNLTPVIFRLLPKSPAKLDDGSSLFFALPSAATISFPLALGAATLDLELGAGGNLETLLEKSAAAGLVRALRQLLRISNDESEQFQSLLDVGPLLQSAAPTVAQKKRFLALPTAPQSILLMEGMQKLGLDAERIASLRKDFADLAGQEIAPPPLITGDDLTTAGYTPGPLFRRMLDSAYDAQLEGRVTTREEAMELAREGVSFLCGCGFGFIL